MIRIHAVGAGAAVAGEGTPVSVADRAQAAFASEYMTMGSERDALLAAGNDPVTASDPGKLIAMQVAMAEHEKRVSFVAAMTHHMVEGIETLLKS